MVEKKLVIRSQGVCFSYPDGTKALHGIELDIFTGDFIAFIGQNGSGKTTLCKHFNGLLKPTSGNVYVYGLDTKSTTVSVLTQKVGYSFQNPDHMLLKSTVEEEISFGPKTIELPEEEIKNRVEKSLELMELVPLREKHPIFLSKSERQRLAIASILAMEPEVLIVDEPTTGMDMRQSYEVMEILKRLHRLGHTIIVITHNMRLVAEYANRIIVMANGKILLDGPPKNIFSKPEILSESFLKPPQITRFAQLLDEFEFPKDILTVEEMYKAYKNAS